MSTLATELSAGPKRGSGVTLAHPGALDPGQELNLRLFLCGSHWD